VFDPAEAPAVIYLKPNRVRCLASRATRKKERPWRNRTQFLPSICADNGRNFTGPGWLRYLNPGSNLADHYGVVNSPPAAASGQSA
jgi:hypothetical protein